MRTREYQLPDPASDTRVPELTGNTVEVVRRLRAIGRNALLLESAFIGKRHHDPTSGCGHRPLKPAGASASA